MTNVWNGASEEQRIQAVNKETEEQEERKKTLWYELVQAFDKKSVLFLRQHKSDDTKTCSVFCKMFKSF